MLIKPGIKHRRIFGIHRRIKAPDFHEVFGTTIPQGDFDLDPGLTNFNQNIPNLVFGTPAQPEGCTGMTDAGCAEDQDKIACNPYFSYEKNCALADVLVGQPVDMVDALNSPQVFGIQYLGETTDAQAATHKKQAYAVNPLNGSLYQGILSALNSGHSVSFAGDWYESFDLPVNGVVPAAYGATSGHNWKFSGVHENMLIAKPWIGPQWGVNGRCYFTESVLNSIGGQAFAFSPTTNANPVVRESIMEALIRFFQELLASKGGISTSWEESEEELQILEQKLYTMENEVYTVAKANLGKHLTLNEAVPDEVGCAEAISKVLSLAGVFDGASGIAGTAQLYDWLVLHFTKIDAPEEGAIIISPTGSGNGSIEGHTGVLAAFNVAFPNDWGIMSNDSASGKFLELWSLSRWNAYYGGAGGLPVAMFRPV